MKIKLIIGSLLPCIILSVLAYWNLICTTEYPALSYCEFGWPFVYLSYFAKNKRFGFPSYGEDLIDASHSGLSLAVNVLVSLVLLFSAIYFSRTMCLLWPRMGLRALFQVMTLSVCVAFLIRFERTCYEVLCNETGMSIRFDFINSNQLLRWPLLFGVGTLSYAFFSMLRSLYTMVVAKFKSQ